MNNIDFDYCKEEFKWFLDAQYPKLKDNVKEQINEFCHNFCFDDLRNIEKINALSLDSANKEKYLEYNYGSNYKDNTDCDDTHLARIIYFLIHNDNKTNEYALPGLNKLTDIGSGYKYKYRGDTLNTYATLFGNKDQGVEKFFTECTQEYKNIIKDYRRKYVTIGNFWLLPAATVRLNTDNAKWDSINSYRGKNEKYRDYFDLFLYNFINQLDFQQWKDDAKDYFEVLKNKDEFIKINMLEKYLNSNTKQISANLFRHKDTNAPYYWNKEENIDPKYYRKFAFKYIKKSTKIIDYRAEQICKRLKEIYY